MLFSFAVAQAISASPPERVDLTIPQPCNPAAAAKDEVVVCANKNGESPYRLREQPTPKKDVPKAELSVAEGVSVAAETESVDVGGFPSERAMIRLKLKF
jgi:hypothetical protein